MTDICQNIFLHPYSYRYTFYIYIYIYVYIYVHLFAISCTFKFTNRDSWNVACFPYHLVNTAELFNYLFSMFVLFENLYFIFHSCEKVRH